MSLLNITKGQLNSIAENFQKELERGLECKGQVIKALPTYICRQPTGNEMGEFLVVDLGGSNLRVGFATLLGGGKFSLTRQKWPLEGKFTAGVELFDFIADKIGEFLTEHDAMGRPYQIGFTFSYPVHQESIAHGILIQWNKSLACDDVIGMDVVGLLHDALNRRELRDIRVAALLNDTVGTLAAHQYVDTDAKIAVILGTGTNAAFMTPIGHIKKLDLNSKEDPSKMMIINVEWGAFGEGTPDYLPLTEIDKMLDGESVNPGKQIFEKVVGGMYLGEIARRYTEKILGRRLGKPYDLSSLTLTEVEETGRVEERLRDQFYVEDLQEGQITELKETFKLVVKRSARLCAATLMGLYRFLGKPQNRLVVAIDGSLYQHYPRYPDYLKDALTEMEPDHTMELQLGKDESIIGAAIVVATGKSN